MCLNVRMSKIMRTPIKKSIHLYTTYANCLNLPMVFIVTTCLFARFTKILMQMTAYDSLYFILTG